MKKIFISLAMITAVFVGCHKSELVNPAESVDTVTKQFVAYVADFDSETKTSMNSNRDVLWSYGDRITIFNGSTLGEEFALANESVGQKKGVFDRVNTSSLGDVFFAGTEIPCNVGFYPYADNLILAGSGNAYQINNVKLQPVQTYAADSFGNGTFPMVAINGDKDSYSLDFKNVLGVLKLQFKGNAWVKSIKIEGNDGEVLCGSASVTVDDQEPVITMLGTAEADKSVVLECPARVHLDGTKATDFFISLPPVTFSKGFKVTVTDVFDNVKTVESVATNVVRRSTVLVMPEIEVDFAYPEEPDFDINLSIEGEVDGTNMTLPQFEKLKIALSYTEDHTPSMSLWESSDPSMLALTECDGYVEIQAIYDGMMGDDDKKSVTITHYAGTKSASKTIDIVRAVPKSIEFVGLPENNILYLGETFGPDFRVVVHPKQASQHVIFIGKEGDLAAIAETVRNAPEQRRLASEVGYFTLQAKTSYISGWGEVQATVYITVKARLVEGGSLSNSTLTLSEGESAELVVDFTPANDGNYDYNVAWESSDETVATVKDGKVTAVAEGTATVSATLSNGDVLTCEVTVQQPVAASVFVGDYYYSDGTWSTELDSQKTVIGVVFSVENPTQMGDTKLAQDKPKATHGLVVAMEETADIKWQESATNVGQWLTNNTGYSYLQAQDRKCGYSNTLGLKAYNAECAEENKVLVAECAPAISLGEATSGWYLPSYAELNVLKAANNAGLVNGQIYAGDISARIVEAGGTPFAAARYNYDTPDKAQDAPSYWASTEGAGVSSWATCMHYLHGGQINRSKGKTYYIARYIFAF